MTERSELIRSGNRFIQMMAEGVTVKAMMRDFGLSHSGVWKAINAARDARSAATAPEPDPPDIPWYRLTPREIGMLHMIRDEIRAADRLAER